MVVIFNKLIRALAVFFIFFLGSIASTLASDAKKPKAYQLSLNIFQQDKKLLEDTILLCEKNRKVLRPSLLESVNLNKEQLKTALFVLNDRAESRCEQGRREQFFYSAAIHRQVAKFYNLDAGEALNYTEDLLLISAAKKMDYKSSYLQLDQDTRTLLESIPELQVPFLLLDSIEALAVKEK